MKNKKLKTNSKDLFLKLFLLIFFGITLSYFLIDSILFHIAENSYYLYYPKFTRPFSIVILVISLLICLILYIKVFKIIQGQSNPSKIFRLLIIIILVVSSSMFFGSLNFLIYVNSKDGFYVDKEYESFQVEKEMVEFDQLIEKYNSKINLCYEIISRLDTNSVLKSILLPDQRSLYQTILMGRVDTFKVILNSCDIYILREDVGVEVPPPPPIDHPGKNNENTKRADLEILTNGRIYKGSLLVKINNESFFVKNDNSNSELFKKMIHIPEVILHSQLKSILNSFSAYNRSKINRLIENKKIIRKRGFPISFFVFESLLKFFNQGQNAYKASSNLSFLITVLYLVNIYLIWKYAKRIFKKESFIKK